MNKLVYIIVVNWNGWKDTIECLDSIFQNNYSNYKVIVCDNNSTDASIEEIEKWAKGEGSVGRNHVNNTINYTSLKKPVKYLLINHEVQFKTFDYLKPSLLLVSINENLGFAGGVNIGIRYAMKDNNMSYIWLLNNDTIIKKNALTLLVEKMDSCKEIGMCGSRLMEYNYPEEIQALGGKYNNFLGTTRHVKKKEEIEEIDYIIGASMLVSRTFIEEVGLMNEEYFLYFEELDWVMRSKKKFKFKCVYGSVVYHKNGSSTGAGDEEHKSEISDYYLIRNRLIFTRKYYPFCIITVYISLLYSIFNRIRRRQYRRIRMIIRILWQDVLKGKIKKYNTLK